MEGEAGSPVAVAVLAEAEPAAAGRGRYGEERETTGIPFGGRA